MTGYINLPFRVVVKVYWCSSLLIFWVTTSSLWSSFRYISNLSLMHVQGFSFDAPLMAEELGRVRTLNQSFSFLPIKQDMTARDLLQQRITLPNGDTSWRYSPLVMAALEGNIAELDGIHRVNPGTLAVLQR